MGTVLTAVMLKRRRDLRLVNRKNCAWFVETELLATITMHLPVKDVKVCDVKLSGGLLVCHASSAMNMEAFYILITCTR
jgi:hypothetical protein